MREGLKQLGDFLSKAEGGERQGHKYVKRGGNPGHYQYTYSQSEGDQSQPIGQTNTGEPIHAVERGPHSVDSWGEVLVGKTTPGHEQEAPRHMEHDGKHWVRAGYNTDSNTVGYHEYQPSRHVMDPTTGFAREAVPVDAKGVAGGLFHVAGLPEHGGGDLPKEINDPHHGKLTVRGFNSDSGMTLYHKDVHNPGWNKPGSTGEAIAGATPPGANPPPQGGQNSPVAAPIKGNLPQGGQPPALKPGQPTVGGQAGTPPPTVTTAPQAAPKPPLPGGPGAPQAQAQGPMAPPRPPIPGSSPQSPLVGQGPATRPPMPNPAQTRPQGAPGGVPMTSRPPMAWHAPGQPGTPPAPAGMRPPMAGPAGSPPGGMQPGGPKPLTPPGAPQPAARQTPGSVPNIPPKPGQPAQPMAMKPPVPGAPPAPPVKPAVGAKKNPFQKGLDALGDWMEKATGGEREGHKYIKREGVTGAYKYTYADDNRTHLNSPNQNQLEGLANGAKVTLATGPNKGVHYTLQGDTWHGDGGKIDHTSMASRTFGNQVTVHHPVGEPKQVAPHMHVISKDSSGAYTVSIGDPTKGESTLKRRFSGPTAQSDLRDWARENLGQTISHNHAIDKTGLDLTPKYHSPEYGPTTKGPTGKVTKRDAGGKESLDFTATEANAPKGEEKPKNEVEAGVERAGQARESMKGFAGYSQVKKYVNSIRNPHKKAYAQAYAKWMAAGEKTGDEPAGPKELGAMGRQAVRLHLDNLKSEAIAPVETEKELGKVAKQGADKAKEAHPDLAHREGPPKEVAGTGKLGHEINHGPDEWSHQEALDTMIHAMDKVKATDGRTDLSPAEWEENATQHSRAAVAHRRLADLSPTDRSVEHRKRADYHSKLGMIAWGEHSRLQSGGKPVGYTPPPEAPKAPEAPEKAAKPQQLKLFGKSLDGLNAIGDFLQKSEVIPGGEAKGKQPSDFDAQALKQGTAVEMEHSSDKRYAREIAMDHLTEDPNYYQKLKTVEAHEAPTTEKCMHKAMTGLEALSGYLSKSLEDPMPDDACKLGYGKSKEVGESPDGGGLESPTRDFSGDRVGDAKGASGKSGTYGIGAPTPVKSIKAGKSNGEKLDVGGDPTTAKSVKQGAGAGTPEDVGGTPGLKSDKLNDEERDAEDQMSDGKSPLEGDLSEKSLTPAGQRAMVAKEHALKVQEMTKSADVQVGVPDHPYMMSSMGNVDEHTEALTKSEFYHGNSPSLAQPGTILRKSVLCKSDACGMSFPAFYTSCPECGSGQTVSRLLPHGANLGGGQGTILEKSSNDPIIKAPKEEGDVMVGEVVNPVLFRSRR